MDACHPLWGLELVYACWLLVGQRFLAGMGSGRKRLNILGAYCPDDQEYLDLRLTRDNVNGEQFINLLPLLRVEVNRLHRASLRADFGPFVGSACCCFPAGNVGLVTPSGRREPLRPAQGEASRERPHSERPAGDAELRSTPFRERAAPGMACFIAVER